MRRVFLISVFALMTVASFGRKHIENATVVADTIYYADNMLNVTSAEQAGYYRLLMTQGVGSAKKDVFQDFYIYFIREILIFQSFSCHYRSDLSSLTGRFSIVPSW